MEDLREKLVDITLEWGVASYTKALDRLKRLTPTQMRRGKPLVRASP